MPFRDSATAEHTADSPGTPEGDSMNRDESALRLNGNVVSVASSF